MREVKKKMAIAILTTMASGLIAAASGVYSDVLDLKKDMKTAKEDKDYIIKKLDKIDDRLYEVYKELKK